MPRALWYIRYTPPLGTLLNVGDAQTLTVKFTPADAADYTTAIASVKINVAKRALTAVANDGKKTFGIASPVFSGMLTGAVSDDGITVNYLSAATAATAVGIYDASTAEAITPVLSDPNNRLTNYDVALTKAILTVDRMPIITWATPADITYGTALSATQLNASANIPGTWVYTPASGTVMNGGNTQTLTAAFMPANAVDYMSTTATVSINILPKTLTAAANAASKAYGAANPVFTGTVTGVLAGDGITVSFGSSATVMTNAGIYDSNTSAAITPVLSDPNSKLGNYAVTISKGTFTVSPLPATIVLSNLNQIYDGTEKAISAVTTPSGLSVIVTYDDSTDVPIDGGVYDVEATISDPNYTGSASGTLIVNQTTISSAANAEPNPVAELDTVSFSVAADNSNGDALTYSWDFGDGTFGTGDAPAHSYTFHGTYHAKVTISNGVTVVTDSVDVEVTPVTYIGVGADSDGDGYSDGFEELAATDPDDAASTPTGLPANSDTVGALVVFKAAVKTHVWKSRQGQYRIQRHAECAGWF